MEDVFTTLKSWHDANGALDLSSGDHHLSLTLKVCYNYFLINLYQRLQRQSPRNQEAQQQEPENMVVAEAAERIFALVEDLLLYWTPEHFPMI